MRIIVAVFAALIAAGCASYSGHGLVPGQATAAEVERVMGMPAERQKDPDGGMTLWYPRGPAGRDTYAARITPGGRLARIEQVLEMPFIERLKPGMRAAEARAIVGPPSFVDRIAMIERDVWEYPIWDWYTPKRLYLQIDYTGMLREVLILMDPARDAPGPGRD